MRLCSYKREWIVLGLILLGTMPLVSVIGAQDSSRIALTDSIVRRGEVNIDPYWQLTIDRAFKSGHWYSDKAPGRVAASSSRQSRSHAQSMRSPSRVAAHNRSGCASGRSGAFALWGGGIAFIVLAFLLGRVAEGLVEGTGAVTAAVFGVGTMAGSLGPTVFGHLPDALALFAAYIVATRARRPRDWIWVGLLAGIGVLVRVPGGARRARPADLRRAAADAGPCCAAAAGGIPAVLVLGWLRLVRVRCALAALVPLHRQHVHARSSKQDLFGVGIPTPRGIWTLLIDGHGLLLVSPVLAIAAAGLYVFWRRQRLEAAVAVAIAAVFLVYTAGYFLPNGGTSPGPRFATAAIPFILLGLPFAFVRWRYATWVLAIVSVGLGLFDELTWSVANKLDFLAWPETIWSLLGTSRREGSLILLTTGAAAAIVAGAGVIGKRFRERPVGVLESSAPEPL